MLIEISFEGNKKVNAKIKDFIIKTDQPVKSGGDETAPSPFDLFLASIGTCTGIYVKSFCEQRNIPTDNIKINQEVIYDNETRMVSQIYINVFLPSDFPEKYKGAIINAANLCKVKKHLYQPPVVEVRSM